MFFLKGTNTTEAAYVEAELPDVHQLIRQGFLTAGII